MDRFFLTLSAVSGFVSVALGAFAAHGLKSRLEEDLLKVFHTGVEYQFYHTFALALVGLLFASQKEMSGLKLSGFAFLFGIVVFSGSLYALALTRVRTWGAVTPLGGLGFLVGWAALAYSIYKQFARG